MEKHENIFLPELDALVVGAGFGGLLMLHNLRSAGMKVRIHETGGGLGGVWYWNAYPGARVDSDFYFYQFSNPDLYKDFDFTERFPDRDGILKYFAHVDAKLDLSKDIRFNTRVKAAIFNSGKNAWMVTSISGDVEVVTWARHLVLCIGFAAKVYRPDLKGMDSFKGEIYHTAQWPRNENLDFAGKRISVIGTGASGVQVIQELGPVTKSLTVYQRTPNIAFPMCQSSLPSPGQPSKEDFPEIFPNLLTTFAGMKYDFAGPSALAVSDSEREEVFEKLWKGGGLGFYSTYFDVITSDAANSMAYDFWAKKTRERIPDLQKKEILAPNKKPHPFAAKRPSLEQNYYEVCSRDNVHIIDINNSPILEVTKTGIITQVEGLVEADAIILATGFDTNTGGILLIDIQNGDGVNLKSKWSLKLSTYFGMTTAGFSNLYFLYGPQAPTAFSNGPTCVEVQGYWLTRLLVKMKAEGKVHVSATEEAEATWTKLVGDIWDATLLKDADSWYQGANIPGKRREPLNFVGGIPMYKNALEESEKNGYAGFMFK